MKSATAWQGEVKYKREARDMRQIECKAFGKREEAAPAKSGLGMFCSALM